jgi:hypothetical protein
MNLEQRKKAKSKLKQTFGAGLTREISTRTGLSKSYVRDWFRKGKAQPLIELEVIALLREIQEQQEVVTCLLNAL